jgi:hypothetical protein
VNNGRPVLEQVRRPSKKSSDRIHDDCAPAPTIWPRARTPVAGVSLAGRRTVAATIKPREVASPTLHHSAIVDMCLLSVMQYASRTLSVRIQQPPFVAITECNHAGDAFALHFLKESIVLEIEGDNSPERGCTQYGANQDNPT